MVHHVRLSRRFIAAIRSTSYTAIALSRLAGYPMPFCLRRILRAGAVPNTPNALARLDTVAKLVGFTGPLFLGGRHE